MLKESITVPATVEPREATVLEEVVVVVVEEEALPLQYSPPSWEAVEAEARHHRTAHHHQMLM